MKKKWRHLRKWHRKMIIYTGLLQTVTLVVQFFIGCWLSWWLSGMGIGMYICFLIDSFLNCHHSDTECLACEFTEVTE